MWAHKPPGLTIAILLMAIQAALVIPSHAQNGATRDPDVLGRLMQDFEDGAIMDVVRWMALQPCLQNERHARQLQVGPFRYYQPHATRPGQSMLPVAVEIAALTALTAALAYQLILRQPLKATTRLPFGLFFAPAIWIGWLVQTALPWPGP